MTPSEFHWERPWLMLGLLAVPALYYLWKKYRSKVLLVLEIFSDGKNNPRKTPGTAPARIILRLAAVILLVLALAGPVGNPEDASVLKPENEIVFLLDVSRSMLARDLLPNRLESMKKTIEAFIGTLKGEKVGLVLFAGDTVLKSPMTSDYFFFLRTLDEVNTDVIRKGGTDIAGAIRKAISILFRNKDNSKSRSIILITDGENLGDDPLLAAAEAAKAGIVINGIQIGDPAGSPVPESAESTNFMTYEGKQVVSRPSPDQVKKIVDKTGGVFIQAETARIDLREVYRNFIRPASVIKSESKVTVWGKYFRFFLVPALLLILLDYFLPGLKWFYSEEK